MYLLSQLWLYLVLACLAGAVFGFALRVLCARRSQEAARADAARQTAELESLHAALRANDEQLAVLSERAESERRRREALEIALGTARGLAAEQQEASGQRIDALMAELERLRAAGAEATQPPSAALPNRPSVSALALLTQDELSREVLAAGGGQAPEGVARDAASGEPAAPDDLKVIDGIGPVNEAWLHQQGVWYFWQIAAWSAPEVAWVAQHLPNFGSRVYRENWVAQAARLAAQSGASRATQPASSSSARW